MNKKQKLKNAVILGLLMSSVTAGSAWADVILVEGDLSYPEGLICIEKEERYDGTGKDIVINHHHGTKLPAHGSYGFWVHAYDDGAAIKHGSKATINVGSITIDSRNYVDSTVNGDRLSVGLLAGNEEVGFKYPAFGTDEYEAVIDLNADNGVNISALTRNGASSYGIYAKKNGIIDVNTKNGDVGIRSSKGLSSYVYDDDMLIHNYEIEEADYANSKAYGIATVDGGNVSINADKGNITIDSYIENVSDLAGYKNFDKYNEQLQKSDIYGISNTKGIVDLSANNGVISIDAHSNNGTANAIFTSSNEKTILSSKYNMIFATADGDGKAYGIYATNGAQVDITGDTYVSGDDGAIVVSGDGINTFGDGEQENNLLLMVI